MLEEAHTLGCFLFRQDVTHKKERRLYIRFAVLRRSENRVKNVLLSSPSSLFLPLSSLLLFIYVISEPAGYMLILYNDLVNTT